MIIDRDVVREVVFAIAVIVQVCFATSVFGG